MTHTHPSTIRWAQALCQGVLALLARWALPLALLVGAALAWAGDEFLPPEQAFALTAQVHQAPGQAPLLRLHWQVAPGYYLYRDRLVFDSGTPEAPLTPPTLPAGKTKFDANFNANVTVYPHNLSLDLPLPSRPASARAWPVTVGWQGCAEAGLCYPPTQARLLVTPGADGRALQVQLLPEEEPDTATAKAAALTSSATPTSPPTPATNGAAQGSADPIAATLASGSLLRTLGVFWVAGLLLSFTPCVLPMVPILSSLIAGQAGPVSRGKGLALSAAYTLGMALVYAALGVAAGLAGEGLAAALQNPWVLGGFALMLSALALSMFGVYELQMPSAIQSRATDWSNHFQGGSLVGVFLMGGLSALVVGPCVAAPLAGALVYISQTRDVVLGGGALFALALGMGVPLLLVGASAGSLLPRAGAWMERVKQGFGLLLLAVAVWMVSPVLPAPAHMALWAVWLVIGAALLGVFGRPSPQHAPTPVAARAAGAGLSTLAVLLLVGAASGGQSVLQPLAHLKPGASTGAPAAASPAALPFQRVSSVHELDTVLAQAQASGQAVMLDFYADWCVACKELEHFTFSQPQVQQRLRPLRLVQADVTANTADHKALLKRFSLFGPPGVVFFGDQAQVTHQMVGFQDAPTFLTTLDRALGAKSL